MTRYISGPQHFAIAIAADILAAARRLGGAFSALGQAPRQQAGLQAAAGSGSRRYTFQAFVTIPAAPPETDAQPGPDWHGVIRAGDGAGRSGGLFTALVSGWELHDGDAARGSHAIATIVAFGPEPADCLSAGEPFVLWRGREVGHGVVTRRIFV